MKKKKYLEFYKKHYGKDMPKAGLCNCLGRLRKYGGPRIENKKLMLFRPDWQEKIIMNNEGKDIIFWACGLDSGLDVYTLAHTFTPLRQTIVLFMAAMEGEL